jgi:hypothetical protein
VNQTPYNNCNNCNIGHNIGHVSSEPFDWMTRRVVALCQKYDVLFCHPSREPEAVTSLLNFAREVAESCGYRATGGE